MSQTVRRCVLEAEAKALATSDGFNVNVVPVSLIRIVGDTLWLVDLFMEKTTRNIAKNPRVSLACWKGSMGFQLKGSAEYLRQGALFEEARSWVSSINPDRNVRGLIVFTPREIFDISPGKDTEKRPADSVSP